MASSHPDPQTYLLLDCRLQSNDSHVTAKQIAGAMGYGEQFVYDSFDSSELLGFGGNSGKNRKDMNPRNYRTIRIPREYAILFLAKHANFTADDLIGELENITAQLPDELKRRLFTWLEKRLER